MATPVQAELNQRKGFMQEGQYVNQGVPPGYPQGVPPPGAYPAGYQGKVWGEQPQYVQGQKVDEFGRRRTRGGKLAACLIACWACTWCCHGPCCCGL